MTRLVASVVVMGAVTLSASASRELVLTQRQAYLMGTRVDLAIFDADRASGLAILERALAAIEQTDMQLSTWKQESDVSALNRLPIGTAGAIPPDLCRLLIELDEWRTATDGAFDPGIGRLTDAWGIHESGRVPTAGELRDSHARAGLGLFEIDREQCRVTRRGDATIDVGAFGKGESLDRAAAGLSGRAWMIDFGGQVSVGGMPPGRTAWPVRLADPRDRSRTVMTVQLKSGSIATSAGSERDLRVDGKRIGHIVDPRTGRPAPYHGSVVVWHTRALVADILSTALYVMGPRDGIAWADGRGVAAAFLIPEGGSIETLMTSSFRRLQPVVDANAPDNP